MNGDSIIPWLTRADLQTVEQWSPNATTYTVKDPVQDEYYSFSQLEFFFLKHLRTPQTFQSLIRNAATELGRKFGVAEIQNYLRQLARDNLIVPQKLGDGERLFQQRKLAQRGQWQQRVLGLLSMKLSGFYPGGWLPMLKPVGWLCCNPVTLLLFAFVAIATVVFAAFSFESLADKVPTFAEMTAPSHLTAVLIGFCLAKILHELGHAIVCQASGHECSEMGVLLLVFMPCLYCDVSDMWTEKSRWQRILVSLAGVLVELTIAIVCFWIWFLTVPGPLHVFSYSLMLITSLNTLFVNGNPLMRYDGYYALADLLQVPNMSAVSRQRLNDRLGQFFLKQESIVRQQRWERLLIVYAVCAAIYRWLIMIAIVTAIWVFFDYQQLRSIGNGVLALVILVSLVPLLIGMTGWWKRTRQWGLRWLNALTVVGLLAVVLYLFSAVNFSHRIWGPCQIQLSQPNYIFASNDGKFTSQIMDGQNIQSGTLIGSIDNFELEQERLTLRGQQRETQLNIKLIEFKSDSHRLAGKSEFWKQREATLQRQLDENQRKRDQLNIFSPTTGHLVAFRYDADPDADDSRMLSQKSGTVFEEQNRDCQLHRGDPICYIGNPDRMRGFMAVDEKDIELIASGQTVKIAVPYQAETIEGKVVEISLEQNEDASENSKLFRHATNGRTAAPVTYRVEIEFQANSHLRIGSVQAAVIICHKTNTIAFVTRWLRNSFWF